MKADAYAQLPPGPDGTRTFRLMLDPAAKDAEGNQRGFLSLVNRGANGRTFLVAKVDDSASDPQAGTQDADPGPLSSEERGRVSVWRWLFGNLFGAGESTAAKSTGPTDFDAAVAIPTMRERMWTLEDGLREVIRNVMEDDEITDKPGAIGKALDAYKAHVLATVQAALNPGQGVITVQVVKAAGAFVRAEPDGAWARPLSTTPERSAIVKADQAVQAAQAALAEVLPALTTLTTKAPVGGAPPPPEDPTMDPIKLQIACKAAADAAVVAAKSAGVTDPAKLAAIATDAATTVAAKAAVAGTPQPSMPTDVLAQQMGMVPFGGTGGMFQSMIDSAIQKATSGLVAKVDEVHGAIFGKGEGEGREPGLRDIVGKTVVGLELVSKGKAPTAPRSAPAGGGGGEGPEQRDLAAKAEADVWAGTALAVDGKVYTAAQG